MERTLRAYVWPMLGYLAILEAMLFAAIWFWPSFRENVPTLKLFASPIPVLKDMLETMGTLGVTAYVTGQHYFKGCNTLGTAAAILFAMGAVAGEAHRGTLELWLARPYSRPRMLLERYFAGALAVSVPVFATSATVPWLLGFVGEEMQLGPLMLCSLHQSLFLLAIYSATFLLSTLSSRPTWIALVMIFLTTFEFALYVVKTVTHWSIYRLVDIEAFARIYSSARLEWTDWLPTSLATLLLAAASVRAFLRRVP